MSDASDPHRAASSEGFEAAIDVYGGFEANIAFDAARVQARLADKAEPLTLVSPRSGLAYRVKPVARVSAGVYQAVAKLPNCPNHPGIKVNLTRGPDGNIKVIARE